MITKYCLTVCPATPSAKPEQLEKTMIIVTDFVNGTANNTSMKLSKRHMRIDRLTEQILIFDQGARNCGTWKQESVVNHVYRA